MDLICLNMTNRPTSMNFKGKLYRKLYRENRVFKVGDIEVGRKCKILAHYLQNYAC